MERVRVKDKAFVGIRSMKIDMVDDTALLKTLYLKAAWKRMFDE